MKKLLAIFMLVAVIGISAPKAHAVTLDDLWAEITSLKSQVVELKTQLSAAVITATQTQKTTIPATGKVQQYGTYAEALDACKKTWPNSSWLHAYENTDGYFCDHGGLVTPEPTAPVVSQGVATITPTPAVSAPQITTSLSRGANNSQVQTLQQILSSLGFFSGETSNTFGAKTEASLRAFQKANGLDAVGTVGPRTRALLNEKSGGTSLGGTGTTPPSIACTPTTTPYIKVLAPNGGELFTAGQQITIKWKTCNLPVSTQPLHIDLIQINNPSSTNVFELTLAPNDDGSETVVLPTVALQPQMQYGNNFKIQIWRPQFEGSGSGPFDLSDNLFTVNASGLANPSLCNNSSTPSIRVISPNGGESYTAGQQITVKWNDCNIADNELVDILIQHHFPVGGGIGGANYVANLIPDGTVNDGIQTVTLPTQYSGRPFGTYFKILVIKHPYMVTGNSVYDLSDNLFTINNTNTTSCTGLLTTRNAGYPNQTVSPNTTNYKIGSYTIQNGCNESVRVTNLKVSLYNGDLSVPLSDLTNLKVLSNGVVLAPSLANVAQANNFAVDFTLASNTTKQIDVYADIGSVTSGTIQTVLGYNAVGMSSGTAYPVGNQISPVGQLITIGGSCSVTSTLVPNDATTTSRYVAVGINGANDATRARYNFTTASSPCNSTVTISELKFTEVGNGNITVLKVGNVSAPVIAGVAYFTGLNLVVPNQGAGLDQDVLVSYFGVGPGNNPSGTTSQIKLTYVKYTNNSSGVTGSITPSVSAPMMMLVGSKPVLSLVQPSTTLVNGLNEVIDVVVSADSHGTIKINSIPLNRIISGASYPINFNLIVVKDSQGNIINTTDTGGPNPIISFPNGYGIQPGTTETFKIYMTISGVTQQASFTTSLGNPSSFGWTDVVGGATIPQTTNNTTYFYNYPSNVSTIHN